MILRFRRVYASFLCFSFSFASSGFAEEHLGDVDAQGGSGRAVDKTVFNSRPSSFDAVVRIVSNDGGCSATFVSDRVLVTAGHCFNGPTKTVRTILADGSSVLARCEKSQGALQTESVDGRIGFRGVQNDIAACKTDSAVAVDNACIGEPVPPGQQALIVGFGQSNAGAAVFSDRQQRQGTFTVRSRRNGVVQMAGDLQGGDAQAALGSGDSGGFNGQVKGGRLFLSAINSAGRTSFVDRRTGRTFLRESGASSFADAMSPASQQFLRGFAARTGGSICGVAGGSSSGTDATAGGGVAPGAIIDRFVPGSFAEKRLSLVAGDRLEEVAGKTVRGARDVVQTMRNFLQGNEPVLVLKVRGKNGTARDIVLQFDKDRTFRERFQLGVFLRDA